MIAPIRYVDEETELEEPVLSEVGRAAAASLLPRRDKDAAGPPVPVWQAWLLVIWMIVTAAAYVAITLGIWRG